MRLRRNSSSPHSSLSPGRAPGSALGTTPSGPSSAQRASRRRTPATPEAARAETRRSQRAESASPKGAPERSLRPRSTSGRGLLDGSGFLSENGEAPAHKETPRTDRRDRDRRSEEEDDEEEMEVDATSEPRRSGRARNLRYACFDPEYMTNDDVIRHRSQEDKSTEKKEGGDMARNGDNHRRQDQDETEESSATAADEEDSDEEPSSREHNSRTPPKHQRELRRSHRSESPFFNHVRFSPSAKPGSPSLGSRRSLRHRAERSRSLRKVRLHNLESEDEQTEFHRRYTRDLRSRKRKEELELEEEMDNLEGLPIRRSSRSAAQHAREKIQREDEHKDGEEEEDDDDEEEEEEEEVKEKVPRKKEHEDDVSASDLSGLRRSKRIHKPVLEEHRDEDEEEESSTEEEEEEEEAEQKPGNSRPRRNRVPVERLTYEAPPPLARSRSTELRNLDQYPSDEEYGGGGASASKRGNRRYNMRENRRAISRYGEVARGSVDRSTSKKSSRERFGSNRREMRSRKYKSYKDSSSSSSSSGDATDEERFHRRKKKRMNIERSKLMPVNFGKQDASRAIFRDRQKSGASLADVSPMEIDLNVRFENVGGCEQHINSLKEMVVLPMVYPELFRKFSITPPRGVLFHGPPGTGKTLMARALASECSRDGKKVAFFMRKGADCLSKWIGESERSLRLLFDQAFLMRPSIIFFDEIDGLAPVRSSRQDQIHSSIVSTLLALMDGLDNRGEIIVIGATNRIENIDPALRRPGRFDRELRFALPTRDARKEILGLHTKTWDPALSEETVDKLAEKSIGYCGADLKGLCAEAALNALRRRYPQVYKTAQKLAIDMGKVQVKEKDFLGAMKLIVPSGQRIQDTCQAPLPKTIRPLLQAPLSKICQTLDKALRLTPAQKGVVATSEDDLTCMHFRPRMLVRASRGQGLTTYVAPAILHHLERFPCHRLDLPALYSNSTRTPEEAVCQIVHEAKRTAPSCLYIPHLNRLWRVMTVSCRDTLLTLLGDVLPTMPLLLLATEEDAADEEEDGSLSVPEGLFSRETGEVAEVEAPSAADRRELFSQVSQVACEPVAEEDRGDEEEVLEAAPAEDTRELTERESKRLRKKEEHIQRELRIYLREVWNKINKEQKFFMFRAPVDTEEVDDYLELIEEPMDFDKMLSKLDNHEYKCAKDFLSDIDLIAENAITYNSDLNYETNKVICHRARALQDHCYALIKKEMDTDFEDDCRDIKERRERLEKQLAESENGSNNGGGGGGSKAESNISTKNECHSLPQRRKSKKRVSSWARGECKKRPRRGERNGEHAEEEEEEGAEEEGEDVEKVGEENHEKDPAGETEKPLAETNVAASPADNSLSQSPRTRRRGTHPSPPSGSATPSSSSVAEMVPTSGVRIDQPKLQQLVSEAARLTEGFCVERLERVLAGMMAAVAPFRGRTDRSELVGDLQRYVNTHLKQLEQQQHVSGGRTPRSTASSTPRHHPQHNGHLGGGGRH